MLKCFFIFSSVFLSFSSALASGIEWKTKVFFSSEVFEMKEIVGSFIDKNKDVGLVSSVGFDEEINNFIGLEKEGLTFYKIFLEGYFFSLKKVNPKVFEGSVFFNVESKEDFWLKVVDFFNEKKVFFNFPEKDQENFFNNFKKLRCKDFDSSFIKNIFLLAYLEKFIDEKYLKESFDKKEFLICLFSFFDKIHFNREKILNLFETLFKENEVFGSAYFEFKSKFYLRVLDFLVKEEEKMDDFVKEIKNLLSFTEKSISNINQLREVMIGFEKVDLSLKDAIGFDFFLLRLFCLNLPDEMIREYGSKFCDEMIQKYDSQFRNEFFYFLKEQIVKCPPDFNPWSMLVDFEKKIGLYLDMCRTILNKKEWVSKLGFNKADMREAEIKNFQKTFGKRINFENAEGSNEFFSKLNDDFLNFVKKENWNKLNQSFLINEDSNFFHQLTVGDRTELARTLIYRQLIIDKNLSFSNKSNLRDYYPDNSSVYFEKVSVDNFFEKIEQFFIDSENHFLFEKIDEYVSSFEDKELASFLAISSEAVVKMLIKDFFSKEENKIYSVFFVDLISDLIKMHDFFDFCSLYQSKEDLRSDLIEIDFNGNRLDKKKKIEQFWGIYKKIGIEKQEWRKHFGLRIGRFFSLEKKRDACLDIVDEKKKSIKSNLDDDAFSLVKFLCNNKAVPDFCFNEEQKNLDERSNLIDLKEDRPELASFLSENKDKMLNLLTSKDIFKELVKLFNAYNKTSNS